MYVEIWINPDCSKCRTALSALDEAGVDYTVRRYLDEPPTVAELETVLTRLGLEPWDIVRMGEAAARDLDDLPRDGEHRTAWLEAMVTHPILIQRPIITADESRAVVARDNQTLSGVISQR